MKLSPLVVLGMLATLGAIRPALAVDHDNIDADRPLDFDDAETIAFRERASEVGAGLAQRRGGKLGLASDVEYLYGFAKNWHLNLGVHPSLLGQEGQSRQFDVGDLAVGVQHNFNRETTSTPAFGFRADAYVPTGRGSRGTDFRLRGIMSRKFGRYGRLHLNADLNVNNSPNAGERRTLPGVLVGYSLPLGYPRRFDRTLVAQVGMRAATMSGDSAITNIGIGVRQQVAQRSVFDLGIKSDIAGGGNDRERFRVIAGYSTSF
ncbi:hypothetical protein EON83_07510 [bacterium]|nr:MAG: hypothetical protein EON83_07510 [bacterium]